MAVRIKSILGLQISIEVSLESSSVLDLRESEAGFYSLTSKSQIDDEGTSKPI